MNKIFGIILPYIMLAFVGIINTVEFEYKVIVAALILGFLIGIWFYCLHKSEGTVMMKLGIVFSLIIFVVALVLGMLNLHLEVLSQLSSMFAMLIGMECMGLYIVSRNKPRLNMTYKYSYRNKRRRYF